MKSGTDTIDPNYQAEIMSEYIASATRFPYNGEFFIEKNIDGGDIFTCDSSEFLPRDNIITQLR